jgi:hypothetical protein
LLFEVDQAAGQGSMSCTECGTALVDYTPDDAELELLHDEAAEGETLMLAAEQVASSVSSGVVATMAIEGLAAKLRAAAEAGEGPDGLLPARSPRTQPMALEPTPVEPSPRGVQPVPVAVNPSPRAVQPVATNPSPRGVQPVAANPSPRGVQPVPGDQPGKSRATKMLDVSELDPNDWSAPIDEGPALPAPPPVNPGVSLAHPPTPSGGVHPAQPGFAPVARKKKKKGKAGLLIFIVVLLGAGGGGFAAWYFTQNTDTPGKQPASTPSEAPLSFEDTLAARLKEASVRVPKVPKGGALKEMPYLAAGMEGLIFSAGQVPGLASARLTDSVLSTRDSRSFVRPVEAAVKRAGIDAIGFALDRKLTARDVLRFAYSAHLAGVKRLGLVVQGADAYGIARFSLQLGPPPPFPDGVLVVRVGKLGFHVTVQDSNNTVISTGEPSIGRRDDKSLDHAALGARLDELVSAHAGVRTGLVHPANDMTNEDLVAIIARLERGAEGPRFPDVRIALP